METYLSKSNRANPDDVMMLRHDLIKLGDTVVEHKGGTYDATIMNNCKRIIACHPADALFTPKMCVMGRGQYSEADYAKQVVEIPISVYHEGKVYPVVSYEKIPGKDSWQEYAYFYLGEPTYLNQTRNE